jgi:hypothetical protein
MTVVSENLLFDFSIVPAVFLSVVFITGFSDVFTVFADSFAVVLFFVLTGEQATVIIERIMANNFKYLLYLFIFCLYIYFLIL